MMSLYGQDQEEYDKRLEGLEEVLQRIQSTGVTLNPSSPMIS